MVQNSATVNQTKTLAMKLGLLLAAIVVSNVSFARPEDKDIFDKMVLDPNLKIFVGLIVKANLVETLKAEGPQTVFAPNNAAFAKLPAATLEAFKNDKVLLKKTLLLHVVPGKVLSKDFKDGFLKTVSGLNLSVFAKAKTPTTAPVISIGGAKIVTPDIDCSNGNLNIVGTILIPAEKPTKNP